MWKSLYRDVSTFLDFPYIFENVAEIFLCQILGRISTPSQIQNKVFFNQFSKELKLPKTVNKILNFSFAKVCIKMHAVTAC